MPEHHRNGENSDSGIVGHARAADGALNFLKNWVGVIALLIGIGWEAERIVGKVETAETESNRRFASIEKSMDDFKKEVRDNLKSTGTEANAANRETSAILRTDEQNQNAYNANVIKALTEIITTMRNRGMPAPTAPDPPKLGGQ